MSSLTITTVQSSIHWKDKAANLSMFERMIRALNTPTEVIILPEMFSTGFVHNPRLVAESMDGETVMWMRRLSAEKKAVLVGSMVILENEQYYNRLVWMLPDGKFGIYDKRHLFGYGGEDTFFSSGTKRFIASVKGWKINFQICYDLRFPTWARQQMQTANAEYDILINLANWPEKRRHAWQTLLQARAIENQAYVVGVNRVGVDGNNIVYAGDSSIIDPLGNVIYTKTKEEDIYTLTLKKDNLALIRAKYPFLNDADKFLLLE